MFVWITIDWHYYFIYCLLLFINVYYFFISINYILLTQLIALGYNPVPFCLIFFLPPNNFFVAILLLADSIPAAIGNPIVDKKTPLPSYCS